MAEDKYVGKRLDGRYEIGEVIGEGGMAVVYSAWDIEDQIPVAIKILRDEYLGNDEFIRRFKDESKAIAVLSHPNIVKVYDVSFGDRSTSPLCRAAAGLQEGYAHGVLRHLPGRHQPVPGPQRRSGEAAVK